MCFVDKVNSRPSHSRTLYRVSGPVRLNTVRGFTLSNSLSSIWDLRLQWTHVPHIAELISKCRSRCVRRVLWTYVPHTAELIEDYQQLCVQSLWGTRVTYNPGLIKGCRQVFVRKLQETQVRLTSTLFGGCWWCGEFWECYTLDSTGLSSMSRPGLIA